MLGAATEFGIDVITYVSEDSIAGLPAGDNLLYAQNVICAGTFPFSIQASPKVEIFRVLPAVEYVG